MNSLSKAVTERFTVLSIAADCVAQAALKTKLNLLRD